MKMKISSIFSIHLAENLHVRRKYLEFGTKPRNFSKNSFLFVVPSSIISLPSTWASILLWVCNKDTVRWSAVVTKAPWGHPTKAANGFLAASDPKVFSLTVRCSVSIPAFGDQFDLDEVEQSSSSNSATSNNLRDSTNSCEMVHASQRLRQGHHHHHAALMHQLNNTGYNREATNTRQSFE